MPTRTDMKTESTGESSMGWGRDEPNSEGPRAAAKVQMFIYLPLRDLLQPLSTLLSIPLQRIVMTPPAFPLKN